MIIAVDLDEVLAHFLPAFVAYHNDTFGTDFLVDDFFSYRFEEVLGGTGEEILEKVYDFHSTEYFNNIEPIEEAVQAIKYLQESYELVLVTARQWDIQDPTYDWIDTHFPDTFSEIYFANHNARNDQPMVFKSVLCQEAGAEVLIEDSLEYAVQASETVDRVYLLDRPWNQSDTLPSNVFRTSSWDFILKDLLGGS